MLVWHHPAGVRAVQVGEYRIQRKIPPEGTAFAFDLPAVCRGGKGVGQINDVGRGVLGQCVLHAFQLGCMVIAYTIQNGFPVCAGQDLMQELIALCAVAATLPARTVHGFTGSCSSPP